MNMAQNFIRFKKFKDLDLFIQNSLDKFFFVEPWTKLYERTGNIHRDIISDKSTIPDLIIYNKTFNKSECFFESNEKTYIKFPRMRFILRPKYKKEYNPIDTYGKNDEVHFIVKEEASENDNIINTSLNNRLKHQKINHLNEPKTFLKQKCPFLDFQLMEEYKNKKKDKKELINNLNILKYEEDKEILDCLNNYVEVDNYIKKEFKEDHKSNEDKKIKDLGKIDVNINDIELEQYKKKKIDIESFFSIKDYNLNDNLISETNNNKDNLFQEIKDFMKNDSIEDNTNKESTNNDNKRHNNEKDSISNKENQEIKNKYFNIFDIDNKFNDIFLVNQKLNNIKLIIL